MNVAVSIIVPIYNTEKYLNRCVDSILTQTFINFECILVSDASPDNSLAICHSYALKDERIKVICNEKNIGLPLTRKVGFENSLGEYILHVDSDDYIEKDMLENLYSKAKSNDYDMVYCDHYRHKDGSISYEKANELSDNAFLNIKQHILGFSNSTVVWNKLIKSAIYRNIEFPIASHNEDKYITLQTLYFSKKIAYVNTAFYHYMNNLQSLTNDPKQGYIRYNNCKNNFNKIIIFLNEKYGNDISSFEPELSDRKKWINNINPNNPKNIIKKICHMIFPNNIWVWLKTVLFKKGK